MPTCLTVPEFSEETALEPLLLSLVLPLSPASPLPPELPASVTGACEAVTATAAPRLPDVLGVLPPELGTLSRYCDSPELPEGAFDVFADAGAQLRRAVNAQTINAVRILAG